MRTKVRVVAAALVVFGLVAAGSAPAAAHVGHRSCAPGAGPLAVSFAQDPALPPGAFGAGVAALAIAGGADDFVAGFHAATCD